MNLPDPLTVDSLEKMLTDWNVNADPVLQMPISFSKVQPFCVESSLLQMIASVSRKAQQGLTLTVNGLSTNRPDFESTLIKSMGTTHILCGWIMASRVLDDAGEPIPKSESRVFSQYLDAMDSYEFASTHATSQSRVNLVCVQGAKREYIQPLYHEEKGKMVVRPYSDVRLFVQDILSSLVSTWTGAQLREVSASLAQLVKELVENSDWWARSDENGIPYKRGKSFRVLSFRIVEIDEENAEQFAASNHHLHNYLQTTLLESGRSNEGKTSNRGYSIKQNSFIELTIVDSGPGLARRWLASKESNPQSIHDLETISRQEEDRAVVDCFRKWITSSHALNRGIGLFSVARMLREKNGFMRLRTGRLAYLFGTHSAIKDVERRVKDPKQKDLDATRTLEDGTHVFMDDEEVAFFLRPWNNKDQLSA